MRQIAEFIFDSISPVALLNVVRYKRETSAAAIEVHCSLFSHTLCLFSVFMLD